jgi:hypothetical protein
MNGDVVLRGLRVDVSKCVRRRECEVFWECPSEFLVVRLKFIELALRVPRVQFF